MTNIEPLETKPAQYLYECECGAEFLQSANAEDRCPECKGKRVWPSERSE